MKKMIVLAAAAVTALGASALDVTFRGASYPVIHITPETNTGLESIYVAYDTSEITEMVISGIGTNVNVSRYSNLGGGYAEAVNFTITDGNAVVSAPQGNMGYIVESDGRQTCFWVVNYQPNRLVLTSATAAPEQECEGTRINMEGRGDAIHYFTIDGRQAELSREISIQYHNLTWEEDSEAFVQQEVTKTLSHLSNPVVLNPPLYCNSTLHISGDRFLKEWGIGVGIESALIYANGVAVQTSAEQTNLPDDGPDAPPSNAIKTETQGMGGSAPADISFRAWVTDAVIHNEWQIASDQDFEYIDYRFNEQTLDYTFEQEGTYYVRFIGSNSDGSCESVGETYTVSIGASDLRIPNAFSPNGDGVNDEWKVGYRSLLTFRCTIFDRYGNEITSFSDPSQGWDGKYKGKLVKPGVYFYVIEATGADGKKYKKGGDINIIKSKRYSETTTPGS